MNVDYPRVLVGALATVIVLTLVVAASTSTAAFGVFNPAWDGAGQLRDVAEEGGANATVIVNTDAYGDVRPNRSVAVVLAPDAYGEDAATVRRFVRAGGTLVVAEDVGPGGNTLLSAVGAGARVDGRPVRDDRHHYRSPALPVATTVATADENVTNGSVTTGPAVNGSATTAGNATLTTGVERLTLNHGSVVRPNGARMLVRTSEFAYLDANRNEQVDDGESLGSHPVVTVERVGEGRVVVVSDPSLFINAMLDRPDNRQFAANLLASETVLLDYSHAGAQPPLALALLRVRGSPLLQGSLLALGVGVVLGGSRLLRRDDAGPTRHTPDVDRLADYLASERGWDPDRVRRLTTGVWGRDSQEADDE